MFQGVLEKKCLEAERLSERRKEEAIYVTKIAEENWEILIQNIPHNSKKDVEETIFDSTLKYIEEIGEYCKPIGMIIYQVDSKDFDSPLEKLGWITLGGHSIRPTEKGYKVLNSLLEIRGNLPVQERNKKFLKSFFRN